MPQIADRTGQRFGRLVAVERVGKTARRQSLWRCQCDCGNTHIVETTKLANGNTKSCGCHRVDFARGLPHGQALTHGHSTRTAGKSPEYFVWQGMKDRCSRKASNSYRRYGGRGIVVCDLWKSSFEAFLADMGPRPTLQHTLDRINNDGNYEPGNCRWATPKVQARNTSSIKLISVNGEEMSISEARDKYAPDVPVATIYGRIRQLGWAPERALFAPRKGRKHP